MLAAPGESRRCWQTPGIVGRAAWMAELTAEGSAPTLLLISSTLHFPAAVKKIL